MSPFGPVLSYPPSDFSSWLKQWPPLLLLLTRVLKCQTGTHLTAWWGKRIFNSSEYIGCSFQKFWGATLQCTPELTTSRQVLGISWDYSWSPYFRDQFPRRKRLWKVDYTMLYLTGISSQKLHLPKFQGISQPRVGKPIVGRPQDIHLPGWTPLLPLQGAWLASTVATISSVNCINVGRGEKRRRRWLVQYGKWAECCCCPPPFLNKIEWKKLGSRGLVYSFIE